MYNDIVRILKEYPRPIYSPEQIADMIMELEGMDRCQANHPDHSEGDAKGGVMDEQPQVMAGPERTSEERAERRAKLDNRVRLDLWKAVWEASQVMTTEQIQDYVLATLREIESDQP